MQNAQQGKIFVKNPDMLLSWYRSIPYDDAKNTETYIREALKNDIPFSKEAVSAAFRQYAMTGLTQTFESRWPEHHKENTLLLKTFLDYYKKGLEIRCGLWLENQIAYIYMGNKKTGFVFVKPERWFEFIPDEDFSDVSPAELQALKAPNMEDGATAGIIPLSQKNLTKNSVGSKLASKEADISALNEEIRKDE